MNHDEKLQIAEGTINGINAMKELWEKERNELLEKIEKLERRNEYLEMNYKAFGRLVRELSDYCLPLKIGIPGSLHTTNLINDHKRLKALCKSYQDELLDIQEQIRLLEALAKAKLGAKE